MAADPTAALRRAIEFHQAGRLPEAEALYREVLASAPRCADALHYLGLIAYQVGRPADAVPLLEQAAAAAPGDASVQANLGETLRASGRLEPALARLQHALALRPDYPTALNNLGNTLLALGRLDEAQGCYQRALALQPDYAAAQLNLGVLHRRRRQWPEALAALHRAVTLQPHSAEAHNALGSVLVSLNRLDEANTALERALALQPSHLDALNNLGSLRALRGDAAGAAAGFQRALAFDPSRADIHSNLILFSLYTIDDPATLAAELHAWDQRHAAPCAPGLIAHPNERSPGRRLRLGYVSGDFRDHVVGYNILPLFERRARDAHEVFAYASVAQPDAITARFRASADHWRDVSAWSDAQLAALVTQDRIDVLVDLSLHTAKNRLLAFARKPAPVQVSFAGYPGGTGLHAIDAHLTDPRLEPDAARAGAPDIPFRLPATFWCYAAFAAAMPEIAVNPLPALERDHVTFGCFNNLAKVTEPALQLWARVLAATPGSRLRLLAPAGFARERLQASLRRSGIAPERIEFVDRQPRAEYLALHQRIDLGLDTFPYNGHTTSLDAAWMGVPVVTLVGRTPVSRAGLSQLTSLGLAELAATTPDDFVRIASTLAQDRPRLAALRAGLRQRMRASPLMDDAGFVRGIEAAYRTLWRRWCAGRMD